MEGFTVGEKKNTYILIQPIIKLLAITGFIGHLGFYFLLSRFTGYVEVFWLRVLCALLFLSWVMIPHKSAWKTSHILLFEFSLQVVFPFAFTYFLLLNNINAYWFASLVFSGLLLGVFSKPKFCMIGYPLGMVTASLLFYSQNPGSEGVLKLSLQAHLVSYFLLFIAKVIISFFEKTYQQLRILRQSEVKKNHFMDSFMNITVNMQQYRSIKDIYNYVLDRFKELYPDNGFALILSTEGANDLMDFTSINLTDEQSSKIQEIHSDYLNEDEGLSPALLKDSLKDHPAKKKLNSQLGADSWSLLAGKIHVKKMGDEDNFSFKMFIKGDIDQYSTNSLLIFKEQLVGLSKIIKQSEEIGLAEKIHSMQKEKEKAQQEALEQRKLAIENLKKADQLKDEFLANTTHELKTPLNGIIGIAESLIEGATGKLSEATTNNLNMISTSGKRLANLVNDILDFSKIQKEKLEISTQSVDLDTAIESVLHLSAPLLHEKQLKTVVDVPADLPLVEADENRLVQVLHNLIGNAIKFTDEGSIEISAYETEDHNITVAIKDSGIGISQDKQDKIFESFKQADGSISRKFGGTGLGLTISKQIIELHGGKIWVLSKENEGATFLFTLPISKNQDNKVIKPEKPTNNQEEKKSQPTPTEGQLDNSHQAEGVKKQQAEGKILLVDDEVINLQVLINHLSIYGYDLTTALNGKEALEKVHNADGRFDLVLLDVMMPVMNGFEFCEAIRKSEQDMDSNIPILMLTAKNQISDLVKAFNLGANDYITKPFIKEELLARVKSQITLSKAVDMKVRFKEQFHAEKLTLLGNLIAGVAHEINTPIGTSLTAASYCEELTNEALDLFNKNTLKKSHLRNYFEDNKNTNTIVTTNISRVGDLIANFKMLSVDHHAEAKRSFNMKKYLNISIDLLTSELGKYDYTFNVQCDPDLTIMSFPGCIIQIITGLVSNSFTHGYQDTSMELTLKAEASSDQLTLIYKDDGRGIPKDDLGKIFDPFYTTKKNQGSIGLGLNIINTLITSKLNGEIHCQSEEGKGAEFTIHIPLSQDL